MIGFIEFIRTQGVVGLAIGVILGAAVARTVTALVEDIINPIIGILLGKAGDLNEMSTTVRGVEFLWGDLLSNLINLIIIAAVVYYGVKLLRLDKLDQKKETLSNDSK